MKSLPLNSGAPPIWQNLVPVADCRTSVQSIPAWLIILFSVVSDYLEDVDKKPAGGWTPPGGISF